MAELRQLIIICWIVLVRNQCHNFTRNYSQESLCPCDEICHHNGLELNCDGKNLSVIPNCTWEKARKIVLSQNKIKEISRKIFERFTNAEHIDLKKNQLDDLPDVQNNFPILEKLVLDGNNFAKIPDVIVSRMSNLKSITLNENNFSGIPFDDLAKLPNLTTLEMNGNNLTEIEKFPPKMFQHLEKLDLSLNKHLSNSWMSSLPNLKRLKALSLRETSLTNISGFFLRGLNNLKTLDLRSSKLISFDVPRSKLASLTDLVLSENPLTKLPTAVTYRMPNLRTLHLPPLSIPNYAFRSSKIKTLVLERLGSARKHNIEVKAFAEMPRLRELHITDVSLKEFPDFTGSKKIEKLLLTSTNLSNVPEKLCKVLKNLSHLELNHNKIKDVKALEYCTKLEELQANDNKITKLPKLSNCKNLVIIMVDSNEIQFLDQSLQGLSHLIDFSAKYNKIQMIAENDFRGLVELNRLFLSHNQIVSIHSNAFSDLKNIKKLHLSYNKFPNLPTRGLDSLEEISVKGNHKLKDFPPPRRLPRVKELELEYAYHCCAFLNAKPKQDLTNNYTGSDQYDTHYDEKWIWFIGSGDDHDSHFSDDSTVHTKNDHKHIKCTPEPGPFVPCDDLMGDWVLRFGVWIVFVLAVCGNFTVIVVILARHTKLDVSRFLISNLAFADLFMGIYLGLLAVVDASTIGNFHHYGIQWQNSAGCRTAGFLATLSSELSVFTLTVITLERYIAIKNAIRVNQKLQLRTAIFVMVIGWIFAIVTATLPLLDVNDYGKFSICLPFDIGNTESLVFLVFLLCFNAAAFMVILFAYIFMYCSIRGSNAWNANDFRVAKRMALLVITDFACWAPIVFLSLTATFGSPLVSLAQAKIFTVFVFPLNSCANPFLYAIFTSSFKKDLLVMCRKVEDKYPFIKITRQRISFSRRSSYSGAISENPNLLLRARRFSAPLVARAFSNSITTNGRQSDSSHSNKVNSIISPQETEISDLLLTERVTSL